MRPKSSHSTLGFHTTSQGRILERTGHRPLGVRLCAPKRRKNCWGDQSRFSKGVEVQWIMGSLELSSIIFKHDSHKVVFIMNQIFA